MTIIIMIFGSPSHIILVLVQTSKLCKCRDEFSLSISRNTLFFTPWENQSSLNKQILIKNTCAWLVSFPFICCATYLLCNLFVVDAFEFIRCLPNMILLQKFAQNDFILMHFYGECSMNLWNAHHWARGFKILLLQTVVELRSFIEIGTCYFIQRVLPFGLIATLN